jgi:hypothetical protein
MKASFEGLGVPVGAREVRAGLEAALDALVERQSALRSANLDRLDDTRPALADGDGHPRDVIADLFAVRTGSSGELRAIHDVVRPFRALCTSLARADATPLPAPDTEDIEAIGRTRDVRWDALSDLASLKGALDAAGDCESTRRIPRAHLDAMEAVLTGDVRAIEARLDALAAKSKRLAFEVKVEGDSPTRAQEEARGFLDRATDELTRVAELATAEAPNIAPFEARVALGGPLVPEVAPDAPPLERAFIDLDPPPLAAIARFGLAEPPDRRAADEAIVVPPPARPDEEDAIASVARFVLGPRRDGVQDDERGEHAPVAPAPGRHDDEDAIAAIPDLGGGRAPERVLDGAEPAPFVAPRPALDVRHGDDNRILTHLGQPVEFGAEKERSMRSIKPGHTLDPTIIADVDGARGWADLDDKGKCDYVLAYKDRRGKFPKIKVLPNPHFKEVSIEPNGWIEVISEKYDTLAKLKHFKEEYGWGHVHISWMRGAPNNVQRAQVAWMRNANLYMFLNGLEERGARNSSEPCWRFSIKGLSIPTEENLELALQMVQGRTFTATPFSKHLHIGLRASATLYGDKNRIGFEARGGKEEEKAHVIDSLLNGLVHGRWGMNDDRFGEGAFRLVSEPTEFEHQYRKIPAEFATLIERHLRAHPSENVRPEEAEALREMVGSARFQGGLPDLPILKLRKQEPPARLLGFDQRIATPLLNYEALGWLTDEERTRAITARGHFIEGLAKIAKKKAKKSSVELATAISDLAAAWAQEARLAGAFKRWLDGGEREIFVGA